MKNLLMALTLCIGTFLAKAQNRAQPCGAGCEYFAVTLKNDGACGGKNDYTFIVTNNSGRTSSIKLFAEGSDGKWKWLGWGNNIAPGKTASFWSCNNTGRWIVYYGEPSYTSSDYPSLQTIQSKLGGN